VVVGQPVLASWVAPLHQEVAEGGRGWPAVGVAERVMQLRRGRLLGCTRGSHQVLSRHQTVAVQAGMDMGLLEVVQVLVVGCPRGPFRCCAGFRDRV